MGARLLYYLILVTLLASVGLMDNYPLRACQDILEFITSLFVKNVMIQK